MQQQTNQKSLVIKTKDKAVQQTSQMNFYNKKENKSKYYISTLKSNQ